MISLCCSRIDFLFDNRRRISFIGSNASFQLPRDSASWYLCSDSILPADSIDVAQVRSETRGCAEGMGAHLNNAGAALMPIVVVDCMKSIVEQEVSGERVGYGEKRERERSRETEREFFVLPDMKSTNKHSCPQILTDVSY